MRTDTHREPTRRVAAALSGLLTALAVLGVGGALLAARPPEFTARTTLMVVPRDLSSAANFYESLSQGTLISTYAELLRNSLRPAAADVGVTTDFQVVPDTALIRVSASGERRDVVARVVADLSRRATKAIDALNQPLRVSSIAEPAVTRATTLDVLTYAAAIGAIALVAAVTAGRLVLRARRGTGRAPDDEPVLGPAPPRLADSGRRARGPAKKSVPVGGA